MCWKSRSKVRLGTLPFPRWSEWDCHIDQIDPFSTTPMCSGFRMFQGRWHWHAKMTLIDGGPYKTCMDYVTSYYKTIPSIQGFCHLPSIQVHLHVSSSHGAMARLTSNQDAMLGGHRYERNKKLYLKVGDGFETLRIS